MLGLLRGIIRKDASEDAKATQANLFRLLESDLEFEEPEDKAIFGYVHEYTLKHGETPVLPSVRDHFNRKSSYEVVDRLEKVAEQELYVESGFRQLIIDTRDERDDRDFAKLVKEALKIQSAGLKVDKEFIKGRQAAYYYLLQHGSRFTRTDTGAKTSGSIWEDTDDVREQYRRRKVDPAQDVVLTGIDQIDEVCGGLRKKELMFWLAAPGELKTTSTLNICYNAAIRQGCNVVIYSLEMDYEVVRNMIYCIHSKHKKFASVCPDGLSYSDIESARLTPEQEDVFFNVIIRDLEENRDKDYGSIRVRYPGENFTVSMLKADAELLHQEEEIHLILVDYVQLMYPEKDQRLHGEGEKLNQVIKDLKQLTMTFNRGEGIPIISPYQANRSGKEAAEKNSSKPGHYSLRAMSQANEAERAADIVAYTYLDDDLRKAHAAKCAVIKNRNKSLVDQFELYTDLKSRFVGVKKTTGPTDFTEDLIDLGAFTL